MLFNLSLPNIFAYVLVLLIAFPVHEFAHAWTANTFGDETPRLNGRLTLNPLAHLDLIGSLMLLFAGFGWAKPVPVNPYALQRRSPAALMLVSLAGPLSNFLMAVLAGIIFRTGLVNYFQPPGAVLPSLGSFLRIFLDTNLVLMLFNLIPLAPLDGDKIADYFLPASWARVLDRIRPYGPIILLVIVLGGQYLGLNILGAIIGPPLTAIRQLLLGAHL
jgi:Zn-dependent protease